MDRSSNSGSQKKRSPQNTAGTHLKRVFAGFLIVFLVMVVGVGCGFLTASMNTKPDLINDIRPPASSQIYDINGNEIANVHSTENRMPVKLAQIPRELQNAFVAVEDNRFYDHMGVDLRGIARAMWANLRGRTVSEGGSTITQQLAKNAYLTQDRTLKRKVQEVFLALQLERQYTKQEILEMYLNQIYFGQGAYGVQAAAKTYFGKNVEDLTLSECAMLAGIPKSPNYYSPSSNYNAAKEREGVVLDQMEKYGYISHSEAEKARAENPTIVKAPAQQKTQVASYFIDYVTQQLIDKYGADAVYKEGLKIYTTIDMDMQRAAEAAIQNLPTGKADGNGILQPQGALVAIDPHNGYVKAMVGGRGSDQFNRATMAVRQPGSAFKPFVFAAALENNFTPSTVIDDSPVKIGGWEPQNYDRTFRGKVSLRDVARLSLNVPTVKIAEKLGIEKPIYYAQEMGITTFVLEGLQNDKNYSTALGGLTKGVTPLELVSAYGTFANKGVHVDPVVIIKVLDRNGKVLEQANPNQRSVIRESSAAELTSMLQDVIQSGTGTRAKLNRPAAGKTGTTSDYHDAWFVGYTPDLVAGVWVGNDNNTSLGGMSGATTPAMIWKAFMTQALASVPPKNFDGSSVSSSGGINELTGKPESDARKKDDGKKSAVGSNSTGGTKKEGAPPAEPTPAAPPPGAQQPVAVPSPGGGEAPEQDGGRSKGRN